MQLPDLPLVVLDTETTGFVPRVHRIMEYASMRVEKGEITDTFEQMFFVEEVPPTVEVLTHIYTKDLAGKPTFEEKHEDILKNITDDTVLVGQNLGFDLGMLKGEGIDLSERPWIDTSMLASLVFPELPSYSLGYLSAVLKLNHEPKHRALGDVRATLELLEAVWKRLLELPEDKLAILRDTMSKSSEGYKRFFAKLPKGTAKGLPKWMEEPGRPHQKRTGSKTALKIPPTEKGELKILEEPLDPFFVATLIDAARRDGGHTHWIAVKNLDALLSRIDIPRTSEDMRVAFPAHQLLDPDGRDRLLAQESFTAEEAILAVKIQWFSPIARRDIAVHGGEEAVWNGKLACTLQSEAYRNQYTQLPHTLLLDHRELLGALTDETHPGHMALDSNTQVIVDDASMLEDTATKAYGWECSIDDLRAAATGNDVLTRFTDLLQLWVEKVRQTQDVRYLAKNDLTTPETKGLRTQTETLLNDGTLTPQVQKTLNNLSRILDEENLGHRIVWIEQWQNGAQVLSSVPERIGALLQEDLLSRTGALLLVPQGCSALLPEILPPGFHPKETDVHTVEGGTTLSITIDPTLPLDRLLTDPPEGKTILLLPSRGMMETLYVKYSEALDAQGVTFICQGMSGGQGRMQAEFLAAEGQTIWLITPWSFEGIDLPADTVDHLALKSLPFDHPSHTVLSRRSQHYRNAFVEYLMPRLLHRLFRLLRTFSRFAKPEADVLILDERIGTKEYGKFIRAYLGKFMQTDAPVSAPKPVQAEEPKPQKKPTAKKKAAPKEKKVPGQESLF